MVGRSGGARSKVRLSKASGGALTIFVRRGEIDLFRLVSRTVSISVPKNIRPRGNDHRLCKTARHENSRQQAKDINCSIPSHQTLCKITRQHSKAIGSYQEFRETAFFGLSLPA
jgi:hypothetical protein